MKRKQRETPATVARTFRRPVRKAPRVPGPLLTVTFDSIEVRHNGWPGEKPQPTDLSLILQIENPAAPEESRVLSSDRLPFRASSGQTIKSTELSPGANGHPLFKGPVALSDHVNLHVRLFIERTNSLGPIVGAALNTVIGTLGRRIPLFPVLKDVLHIQIGKIIATELARATVIMPVAESSRGVHPVAVALVSPHTIPGVYAPPGSPEPFKKGVVAREGELAALLHLHLDLQIPNAPSRG